MFNLDKSLLDTTLTLLESRGLVRVLQDHDTRTVRFKHALTRDATYNSMLQSRRSELHRAAAQTLTALHPQPNLEMVLTIADHWERGGQDGHAVDTLAPFTQRLIYTGRSFSLTAVLTRLERDQLSATQQHDTDMALADAHAARGEFAQARALYTQVLAQPLQDAPRAQVLHSLGVVAYHLHDNTRAIEYQTETLRLAAELADVRLQARAAAGLGFPYWNLGDYGHAEHYLQQSRSLAAPLGESIELANAEYGLAGIALDRGEYATAIGYAEHALALYETFGHLTFTVRVMQILGSCYYGMKDLARAAQVYQRSIDQSRELGDRLVVALGLGNLAEVYTDWNQLPQAAATYADAIRLLRALKYEFLLAYDIASLASVQIRQAAEPSLTPMDRSEILQNADAHVAEALVIATRIDSVEDRGLALRVRAELQAARGNWDGARADAQQAVRLFEPLGRAIELERAQAIQTKLLNTAN